METNSDEARSALLVAERAAAAPYVDYPASPAWFVPVAGLWFGAIVGSFALLQISTAWFVVALAGLLGLEAAGLAWMSARHGALPMPGTGTPPAEIRPVWRGYGIGCAVVVVVVALLWWQLGVLPAALATVVLVTAGLAWYERAYVRAAARVVERLA